VKAAWEVKPLEELTTKIGSGATPRGGKNAYKVEGLSLIRSLNVHDLEFRMKDLAKIDDDQADALSNVVVEPHDVLLNITGASIARCSQVPEDVLPARVNQHVAILRPKPNLVDSRFLTYLLVSKEMKDRLLGIGDKAGATRQALTKSQLQSFLIPLPPLEEQQRIVVFLDEAFEGLARARAHAEANLQNARELVEAGLGTAFSPELAKQNGWDLHELKNVADLNYGYTTKAHSEPTGPRFLRITDIQDGTVDWSAVPYCDAPPEDYERYRVKAGDIVFARTGATTGKSYLLTEDVEAVAASYLIRLRLKSTILLPEYLALFFLSDVYWMAIKEGISGSAQGGFNASKLGELTVPVPPVSTQREVISRLEEIRDQAARLAGSYGGKLQDLDDLRQSLLQKAFAGELT
tara:strand:+ start:355 stop:1575 length:1221 start_codon:yes stop_codon:yes gene_type:complete